MNKSDESGSPCFMPLSTSNGREKLLSYLITDLTELYMALKAFNILVLMPSLTSLKYNIFLAI